MTKGQSQLTTLQLEYIQACKANIQRLCEEKPEVAEYMKTLTPDTLHERVVQFDSMYGEDNYLKPEYQDYYMSREHAEEWGVLVELHVSMHQNVLSKGTFSDKLGPYGSEERHRNLQECYAVALLDVRVAELMWDWNPREAD